MTYLAGDNEELRKARGAFFTPSAIAEHMSAYAIAGNPEAKVLDPTCGEAVFLLSAGRQLKALGRQTDDLDEQLYGVDLHESSLREAMRLLEAADLDAHLVASDFFALDSPDMLEPKIPYVDAVVGIRPSFATRNTQVTHGSCRPRRRCGKASVSAALHRHGLPASCTHARS